VNNTVTLNITANGDYYATKRPFLAFLEIQMAYAIPSPKSRLEANFGAWQ
jgi:hypothetical protein